MSLATGFAIFVAAYVLAGLADRGVHRLLDRKEVAHGARFAIEFRHPGWHQPRTVDLLGARGVCWVWSDSTPLDHQEAGAFELLPDIADFLYVRLMGDLSVRQSEAK